MPKEQLSSTLTIFQLCSLLLPLFPGDAAVLVSAQLRLGRIDDFLRIDFCRGDDEMLTDSAIIFSLHSHRQPGKVF